MNTTSTELYPAARSYRRRTTPWAIRLLLGVSVLFGVWVDVSSIGISAPNPETNGANRHQVHLLGLSDEHSSVATVVKTLASRRS